MAKRGNGVDGARQQLAAWFKAGKMHSCELLSVAEVSFKALSYRDEKRLEAQICLNEGGVRFPALKSQILGPPRNEKQGHKLNVTLFFLTHRLFLAKI